MTKALSLFKVEDWAGVWTALITPFEKSSSDLKIDHKSLEKLIESQISNGIRGLVIAGSTGEGSLLNRDNYVDLLTAAHKITSGRVPLVAGVGIGSTESCLVNLAVAKKIGYQGVLAAPPAYIKAPQRGLKTHFLKLAEQEVPLCLYEIAGRTASSIEVSTLAELARDTSKAASYLVAIKDASANMQRALNTQRMCGKRFAMLSGDDGTFVSFLASGGSGIISVVSHLTPRALNHILTSVKNAKLTEGIAEQQRLNPFIDALFWESNPIPVKSLLHKIKQIAHPYFSEPLCGMSPELLEKLFTLFQNTGDHS